MNAFLAFALVAGGARTSGAVQDELVARRMTEATAAEDLFHGAEAIGGIGDWYLTNGIVEAIVDDVGFQEDVLQSAGVEFPLRNSGYTGGALVDLGLVGRENDQFGWLSQFFTGRLCPQALATWPGATAASACDDRRPTTMVSTTPKSIIPTWTTTTGMARRVIFTMSARPGF